ncbi:Zinc finger MYM-type protein 1 [Merluccius polli]|uniref:Zinc finger MYM-type protein 1 n=1 Tax=Merluccius polli TaxID=89951 RepID=A0AA47MDD8_MERPO|nr:Zinc finger MYM-type protein 1 [Merluccius polli]
MHDRSRNRGDRELTDNEDLSQRTEPYQPHPQLKQTLSNRVLSFQERNYSGCITMDCKKGVLCFYCKKVYQEKSTPFAAKAEPAFITTGFRNWKRAIEKLKAHESSHKHCHAVSVTAQENHTVDAQLSSALANQQAHNRHCLGKIYAIIIDGPQDISGQKQESICRCDIDNDLMPHEEFIGLYCVSETTGKELARFAKGVLLRLNLPIHGLRGQTYDGAANKSGKHSGAQALIKQEQPLALYVHCGAHCTNVIAHKACLALIRDSLDWIGVLLFQSGKFNLALSASNTASTTNGFLLVVELECLDISFQKRTETVGGMKAAVEVPITTPQSRIPPKWFTGGTEAHQPKSAKDNYRVEFFKVLDTIDAQFTELFNQDGLLTMQTLEETVLSGEIDATIIDKCSELNRDKSAEAAGIIRGLPVAVRGLFGQVKTLVRLLLVVPVSSSEAERSFSALCRLKTWLRSTMTQNRHNHVAVCHIYQNKLDLLDKESICKQFMAVNDKKYDI